MRDNDVYDAEARLMCAAIRFAEKECGSIWDAKQKGEWKMTYLLLAAQAASSITGIAAAVVLLVRPLRDKLLGFSQIREGQKCLLRQQMLNTYYRHKDDRTIRQYEYENFLMSYSAYKALGGNSFIEKIKDDVDEWTVVS